MNDEKKCFGCGFWRVDDNNKCRGRSKALEIVVGMSGKATKLSAYMQLIN